MNRSDYNCQFYFIVNVSLFDPFPVFRLLQSWRCLSFTTSYMRWSEPRPAWSVSAEVVGLCMSVCACVCKCVCSFEALAAEECVRYSSFVLWLKQNVKTNVIISCKTFIFLNLPINSNESLTLINEFCVVENGRFWELRCQWRPTFHRYVFVCDRGGNLVSLPGRLIYRKKKDRCLTSHGPVWSSSVLSLLGITNNAMSRFEPMQLRQTDWWHQQYRVIKLNIN